MAINNSLNYNATQYSVQTGGANNLLNEVAPSATVGNPFVSQGSTSQPSFSSTATVTQITISNAPSAGTDGTNKTYVDAAVSAVNPAVNVTAATTTNLNATYLNGVSGIGATLTNAGTLAAFTIDGVTPTLNQRVLVKNQTSTFQNGVYLVSTLGTGSVAWILTRALDYDQPSDINNTGIINVLNGTVNAGTGWVINSTVTTVGTDAITYTQFIFSSGTFLQVANNLSDLNSASTARTNLGLTPVATQTVTQYDVLIGGASNSIISIGPGTSGQILQSTGNASNPAYSTSTYPTTNSINTLLYASAANVMSALATANNGTLITGTTGIPSILANGTTGQILTATTGSPPSWANAGAGSGTVTNVSGTVNQIDVATGTTTPVISLDSAIITPGSLKCTTLFTASEGQVVNRTATAISYSAVSTDYIIGVTDTTSARTITLLSAPTTNQVFIIKDESGAASVNNISITVSGGSITIDGLTTQKINTNYGAVSVYFNGTNYFFM